MNTKKDSAILAFLQQNGPSTSLQITRGIGEPAGARLYAMSVLKKPPIRLITGRRWALTEGAVTTASPYSKIADSAVDAVASVLNENKQLRAKLRDIQRVCKEALGDEG